MKCPHCGGTGKVKENNIDERERDFASEVWDIYFKKYKVLGIYDAFVAYWTERNPNGTKMAFEMKKTFNIDRRLQTWIRNDKKFNPKKEYNEEKIKMPAGYGNKDSSYWEERSSNHEPKKISELIKTK